MKLLPGCLQAFQWPGGSHQTVPVQEVDKLPKGKPKGVGMCVGPIFSSTPTTLDWLQYYAGKPARLLCERADAVFSLTTL